MRTLITGINGFTGPYLQAELAEHGHEVVGLLADLNDAEALDAELKLVKPDWVVHLAGVAYVGHGEPNDFYQINLIGTRNLLAALAGCGKQLECVLLVSSANVYGSNTTGVLSESSIPKPTNDYAVSKLAMEYMARLWLDKLPIVVVRPFNYTGVGQSESFLIPKIVRHIQRGLKMIELGNVDIWRDFSDVRFVAEVYRRLLEVAPIGETVNICSGQARSLREIVDIAMEISGCALEVCVTPAFVRANEVRLLCGDASKMKRMIGETRSFTLQETLHWMIETPT